MAEGKHIRQSSSVDSFGHVALLVEPDLENKNIQFVWKIKNEKNISINLNQTRPSPPAIYKSILNVCNRDVWVMTCDSLFVGRAGFNQIFSTIDIDRINPPLQILDNFYR